MAKTLKEGQIEELKTNADIQTVVSGYVNLKKSGKNYTGLCPFHKEKTPSFTVDSRKQLYHCFGCGEGGDVISFIMKVENLDFIEAAEFLAKKVNYNLQYIYTGTPEQPEKRSKLVEICELAKKYYNYILFNSKVASTAHNYLKDRGFKKETVEYFELGYSPESWSSFSKFAVKRGYSLKEITDSGLSIQSTRGRDEIYDRFRGRIMFPIKDIVGKTIGFGGRIINGSQKPVKEVKMQLQQTQTQAQTQAKSQAKYINSPETKIYSKSKSIYGLFEAKNNIVE
ncbi:MAG: DNA primase, partial [Actinobacteria bacterium]|nr:DNA primase [Actinomycetota bacterium]